MVLDAQALSPRPQVCYRKQPLVLNCLPRTPLQSENAHDDPRRRISTILGTDFVAGPATGDDASGREQTNLARSPSCAASSLLVGERSSAPAARTINHEATVPPTKCIFLVAMFVRKSETTSKSCGNTDFAAFLIVINKLLP